mgnify:CR=1 FL=1
MKVIDDNHCLTVSSNGPLWGYISYKRISFKHNKSMKLEEDSEGVKKMDDTKNFEEIKERFKEADVDGKIEIYTTVQDLTVDQYKELLRMFPIKYLEKLERAMA